MASYLSKDKDIISNINQVEVEEKLNLILDEFDRKAKIKAIERTTNHDVKAVEYYQKYSTRQVRIKKLSNYIHFGCTSEDINNLAYGLMINKANTIILLASIDF